MARTAKYQVENLVRFLKIDYGLETKTGLERTLYECICTELVVYINQHDMSETDRGRLCEHLDFMRAHPYKTRGEIRKILEGLYE